jgi:hypothetical protein
MYSGPAIEGPANPSTRAIEIRTNIGPKLVAITHLIAEMCQTFAPRCV